MQKNDSQIKQHRIISDLREMESTMRDMDAGAMSHHIETQQQMKMLEKALSENQQEVQAIKESLSVLVKNSLSLIHI